MIGIRWRPEVAQGETDRTLTAASAAVLDVQEDGLRLTWQLALDFRRAEREQFSVDLPAGYLLEKVEGNNVRGWEIRKTPRGQSVEVSLLQAAKDHEQFTLRLWRGGVIGGAAVPAAPRAGETPAPQPAPQVFDVPLVTVPEAALHRGELVIRRSPLLEVRTVEHSGVTRIDLPDGIDSPAGSGAPPLGVRPLEAYRFAAVPFTLRLEAKPAAARVSATVQTVLRLAEYEREMESRVLLDVQGRQVYRLQMYLPERFRLDRVSAPGEFQYAVTQQAGRPLLTVYLAAGQAGDVPVVLSGKLGQPLAPRSRLRLRNHNRLRFRREKSPCRGWNCWAWTASKGTWLWKWTRPSTSRRPAWPTANRSCWANCSVGSTRRSAPWPAWRCTTRAAVMRAGCGSAPARPT